MAWVRCCGGGGSSKKYIYKDGVLSLAIANYPYVPYTYRSAGYSRKTGTMTIVNNNLKFETVAGGTSFISDPIDVTDLSTITINVASRGGGVIQAGFTGGGAVGDNYSEYNNIELQAGLNIVSCSGLTGNYRLYFTICSYSAPYTLEISEIMKA